MPQFLLLFYLWATLYTSSCPGRRMRQRMVWRCPSGWDQRWKCKSWRLSSSASASHQCHHQFPIKVKKSWCCYFISCNQYYRLHLRGCFYKMRIFEAMTFTNQIKVFRQIERFRSRSAGEQLEPGRRLLRLTPVEFVCMHQAFLVQIPIVLSWTVQAWHAALNKKLSKFNFSLWLLATFMKIYKITKNLMNFPSIITSNHKKFGWNLTSEEIQVKVKGDLTLRDNQDIIVSRLERSRLDKGDVATGGDVGDGLRLVVTPHARLVKRQSLWAKVVF